MTLAHHPGDRDVPSVANIPLVVRAVATQAPAGTGGPAGLTLVECFHPSRQNTHTGKVTPAMYDEVSAIACTMADPH